MFWVVLFVLFIILVIVFILVSLLLLRPLHTTEQTSGNNLQSNFNNGDGTIAVNEAVKPFTVIASRDNFIVNAVTFSDLGITTITNSDRVVANMFQTIEAIQVVALQAVADLFLEGSEPCRVAIFKMSSRELLLEADVSPTDPIENAFRTHHLVESDFLQLEAFEFYAVVSVIRSGVNAYATNINSVQPVLQIRLISNATVPNSSVIALPNESNFAPAPNNIMFGSFEIRRTQSIEQRIFEVNALTGHSTFPTDYVYNLNVQTRATGVFLEPGLCINSNNDINMNNIEMIFVSASASGVINGLDQGVMEPNQWYGVFLLNSNTVQFPPGGLLSKNMQEPFFIPDGFNCFRRISWARTNGSAQILTATQTGNGTRRRSFYQIPQQAFTRDFTNTDMDPNNTIFYKLDLSLVSPLATSCVLRVRSINPNNEAVKIFLKPIGTNVFPWVLAAPNSSATQTISIGVPVQPLPHAVEIGLRRVAAAAPNNVTVTVDVVSYFDDV